MNGQVSYGTYTFDTISGQGQITLKDSSTWDFYTSNGTLYIDDTTYTRDYVTPVSNAGIIGVWYDAAGAAGTITFYDDSSVLVDTYGVILTGTYSFDSATGAGLITLPETSNPDVAIYLSDGVLDVNGVYFTMNYVEQADYSGQ